MLDVVLNDIQRNLQSNKLVPDRQSIVMYNAHTEKVSLMRWLVSG